MSSARELPLPFDGRPHTVSMGTRPMAPDEWLLVDHHRGRELALKADLLRERPSEVFAALPGSDVAGLEVLELVLADLMNREPPLAVVQGDRIVEQTTGTALDRGRWHPLDLASRLVQEDLCVMERASDGDEWILTAASVCFPSRWLLAEKIGRTLAQIHDPVPGYPRIQRATDLTFDRLSVDRPLKRANWTLLDDPTLFQPRPEARTKAGETVSADVLHEVFLRVERQTVRALPASGAGLFTIHTSVEPLSDLSSSERRALVATLRTVDAATVSYKGWASMLGRVINALDASAS